MRPGSRNEQRAIPKLLPDREMEVNLPAIYAEEPASECKVMQVMNCPGVVTKTGDVKNIANLSPRFPSPLIGQKGLETGENTINAGVFDDSHAGECNKIEIDRLYLS
jgi:hypothetical protein